MQETLDRMVATLVASAEEVFATMVFSPLAAGTQTANGVLTVPWNVMAVVAFAGAHSGSVAFYCTEETAPTITGAMAGLPPADVQGEMTDAIGEITNMIAGTFRTKMADPGTPWAISVPTVIVGDHLRTRHVGAGRTVLCTFTTAGGNSVFMELILT